MTTPRRSTFEQRNLLHRLGIELDAPWVWISSDGPIAEGQPAPRLRVDGPDGFSSACPFPYLYSTKWVGYSVTLAGLATTVGQLSMRAHYGMGGSAGLPWAWEEDGRTFAVELVYQQTRWLSSILYAEYVIEKPGIPDASIRNAMLAHRKPERARAWQGMDLLLKGPRQGRPRGPVKGGEVKRWVSRGLEIGEQAARGEFKAETPPGRGAWDARYQWWYRHVRPRLQKPC